MFKFFGKKKFIKKRLLRRPVGKRHVNAEQSTIRTRAHLNVEQASRCRDVNMVFAFYWIMDILIDCSTHSHHRRPPETINIARLINYNLCI